MKILYYCPLKSPDDPVPSGDREFARGLQDFFKSEGHEVLLVSRFKAKLFYRSPLQILIYFFHLLKTFWRTLWFQPDVVFVYHAYYKCPDALGWMMARIFSKPYFIFEGSYSESPRRRWEDKLGYWIHRASLATAHRVYTNILGDIPGLNKVLPAEKIQAIAPSLNWSDWDDLEGLRQSFRSAHGDISGPQIVSVAMLRADRKTEGVKFLIQCLARLKNEGYEFTYQHVGGGPCFEEVKKLCDDKGLKYRLWGSLPATEVRRVLSIGQMFAFPGIDEGLGLAYLEAQAAGLPCVAFDNGGIPEVVIRNESGFLIPLMDEDAFVTALKKLLDAPILAIQMGQAGRERVKQRHNRQMNYSRMMQDMETFKD